MGAAPWVSFFLNMRPYPYEHPNWILMPHRKKKYVHPCIPNKHWPLASKYPPIYRTVVVCDSAIYAHLRGQCAPNGIVTENKNSQLVHRARQRLTPKPQMKLRAVGRGGAMGAFAPHHKGPPNRRVRVKLIHRMQEMWTSSIWLFPEENTPNPLHAPKMSAKFGQWIRWKAMAMALYSVSLRKKLWTWFP